MRTAKITAATSPTLFISATGARRRVHIQCDTAVVHVGDRSVATTTGLHMDINDKVVLEINGGDELWAVSTAGAGILSFMEIPLN